MRRTVAAASVVVLAAVVVAGLRAIDNSGAEAADDTSPATASAPVERRDLTEYDELSGTLGYGDASDVALPGDGVITALAELGSIVERGDPVVEVDGVSIPLWYGDRPLWRILDASSSDGEDIRQVEENLAALGFATSATMTVDDDWTAATTAAVRDWQESLGVDETGRLEPGDIALLPGPVRVAGHPSAVGQSAAGTVATVTAVDRQVTIDIEATQQTLVETGQEVEVVLPDGTVIDGIITDVGTVAETDDGGDPLNPATPTIEVVVDLDDSGAGESFDQAPVTVRVTTSAATDVLAVPVDALLALAEGGYAVERITRADNELVPVEVGAFADGFVEVIGDLDESDDVVVPA